MHFRILRRMAKVQLCNVVVLDNPAPFLNPFQFELTFECIEELKEGMYLGNIIMIYYYFILYSHGVIFWGRSTYGQKLFILQKRALRLMTGHGNRTSCRKLFKQLKYFTIETHYIFSILLFVIKNRNLFTTNFANHNIQTRRIDNLYHPSSSLSIYQNGAYFTGIKIFNTFSLVLKQLVEFPTKFKGT
jgi:hypothetical protein